ncbi:MAG: RNA helicase, partial [Proteobacteria bacterium]
MPEVVSSFKQFSFDDRITAALDQLSFKTPTPIQAQGIGPILEGRDILGLARTGTGKTAAFALPIIQDLLRYDDHSTRAVVIAPTRPLARQIGDMFEQLAQNTSLRTGVVYGGTSRCEQLDQIRHGVDVLVGTPGRLADFATSGQINLDQVRFLVIDEVDAILSQGYLEHVLSSVDCLPDRCRQTLMFSATLPEQVEHLVAKLTNQAVRIEIDLDRPLETIEHIAIIVPRSEKMGLLKNILAGIEGASLVFVSSRGGAEFVGRHLIEAGLRSAYLHAEMPQPNREWTVEVFRKGLIDTLVSTDLLGRGFDLPELA